MTKKYLSSNVCPVYRKVFAAVADSPFAYSIADSVCRQASKYKIPSSMSAQEIIAAVNFRHAQSTEADSTAVEDKYPEPSALETKAQYRKRLIDELGLSPQAAADAADEVFGGMDKAISGKAKKAVLQRLYTDSEITLP